MRKIVITAGGTSEKIDNVRRITNYSSGKTGMTVASEFLKRDDTFIYYICSKSALRPIDDRVKIIEIEDTMELKNAVENVQEQIKAKSSSILGGLDLSQFGL